MIGLSMLGTAIIPSVSQAQTDTPMTATQSDPRTLGWMTGFPPPDDKAIRFADSDYFAFPKSRWTVCHFRELMPTVGVPRGSGAAVPFVQKIDTGIDAVSFTPLGSGKAMNWRQTFDANYTDGIIVLHRGAVVYERYAGCLDATGQHGAMSVTRLSQSGISPSPFHSLPLWSR
ncbi:hypothetical protein PQR46_35250 [Paraburkholderia sediminicola]|uniref:hypothetical protein n=1 Tax=Paraburkholderia TaxID=1822464 RepID=UPI0038B9039D